MSKNTCRMLNPLGSKVSDAGFFWGGKVTKGNQLAVNLNGCSPLPAVGVHAHESGLAPRLMAVLNISSPVDNTKICKPVVTPNPVDVVNFPLGPLSVGMKPSKPVHTVAGVADFHSEVSASVIASSNVTDVNRISRAHTPRKNPGFRVVVEKFAQMFCGKIGLSHDAVLSLIGQRPRGVSALAGLRHFNTGGA